MLTVTVFERIAFADPGILVDLQWLGLLVISDHLPLVAVELMRERAYRRIGRRLRQVKSA